MATAKKKTTKKRAPRASRPKAAPKALPPEQETFENGAAKFGPEDTFGTSGYGAETETWMRNSAAHRNAETRTARPGDAGPKTEFSGRYRVLSQIRFMCPLSKKARNQLPYVMLPGDPKKGIKARKAAAYLHCPSEISKQQVNDFFAKGCLAAAFE